MQLFNICAVKKQGLRHPESHPRFVVVHELPASEAEAGRQYHVRVVPRHGLPDNALVGKPPRREHGSEPGTHCLFAAHVRNTQISNVSHDSWAFGHRWVSRSVSKAQEPRLSRGAVRPQFVHAVRHLKKRGGLPCSSPGAERTSRNQLLPSTELKGLCWQPGEREQYSGNKSHTDACHPSTVGFQILSNSD